MMRFRCWMLRAWPRGVNQMGYCLKNNRIVIAYVLEQGDISNWSFDQIKASQRSENRARTVHRFVNQMQIGDIVVVPDGQDIYFAKINSDYIYEKDLDINVGGSGFPHQKEVMWFFDKKPVSRDLLPLDLVESLRYSGTICELTKHADLILQVIGDKDGPDDVSAQAAIHSDQLSQEAEVFLQGVLRGDDKDLALRAAEIILMSRNHR